MFKVMALQNYTRNSMEKNSFQQIIGIRHPWAKKQKNQPYTKINSKWVTYLEVNYKAIRKT